MSGNKCTYCTPIVLYAHTSHMQSWPSTSFTAYRVGTGPIAQNVSTQGTALHCLRNMEANLDKELRLAKLKNSLVLCPVVVTFSSLRILLVGSFKNTWTMVKKYESISTIYFFAFLSLSHTQPLKKTSHLCKATNQKRFESYANICAS